MLTNIAGRGSRDAVSAIALGAVLAIACSTSPPASSAASTCELQADGAHVIVKDGSNVLVLVRGERHAEVTVDLDGDRYLHAVSGLSRDGAHATFTYGPSGGGHNLDVSIDKGISHGTVDGRALQPGAADSIVMKFEDGLPPPSLTLDRIHQARADDLFTLASVALAACDGATPRSFRLRDDPNGEGHHDGGHGDHDADDDDASKAHDAAVPVDAARGVDASGQADADPPDADPPAADPPPILHLPVCVGCLLFCVEIEPSRLLQCLAGCGPHAGSCCNPNSAEPCCDGSECSGFTTVADSGACNTGRACCLRSGQRCSETSQCCQAPNDVIANVCVPTLRRIGFQPPGVCERCPIFGNPCGPGEPCCGGGVCKGGTCTVCPAYGNPCSDTAGCCAESTCIPSAPDNPNGTCCAPPTFACGPGAPCCAGAVCANGTCTTCATGAVFGNTCGSNSECCPGQLCFSGSCCVDNGNSCTADGQCCSKQHAPAGVNSTQGCAGGVCVGCIANECGASGEKCCGGVGSNPDVVGSCCHAAGQQIGCQTNAPSGTGFSCK